MSRHGLVLAACSLLLGQAAAAQDTSAVLPPLEGPASLTDAAREAVSWHPSIVEAAARLQTQQQRIGEVRAGLYPQVSAGIGSGYDSTLRGDWRPRPSVDVSQRLFDFGKLSSELASERAGVRVAEAQVLLSVDAILRDTAYSFIEIGRGGALLEAAREQLGRVQSISELVDARYQRGAATRSDAYQTRSRLDAAQSTIQQIEGELLRWQTNLAYLLGRETAVKVTAPVAASLPDSCRAPLPDWAAVPAMREAEAQLERADAQLERSRAEQFPTISLGAGGSTDLLDPLGDRRSRYDFGLRVDSNIFNGGGLRARVRGAQYARAAADAARDTARLQSTRQLAEASAQVTSLEARVATLAGRFGTMEQTRELYRLQYLELGTRTLVDLLNADQELGQIRFDEVNARHDLARLGVDCLQATGRLRETLGLAGTTIEGVRL